MSKMSGVKPKGTSAVKSGGTSAAESDRAQFAFLDGLGRIRLSGASAPLFVHTMTTVDISRLDKVGTAAAALVLTGQAEIIDLVIITRTGDTEYMLTTHPSTKGEVFAWLEAHAELSDETGAVFSQLELEDKTKDLKTVAVYGPAAHTIIDDLAAGELDATLGGRCAGLCTLDGLPAFVFSYPLLEGGYFELSVAPSLSPSLEHLLLSFPEIDPASWEEYCAARQAARTWFSGAERSEYCQPDTPELSALLRTTRDFVGARALKTL
ncbi:MAG: hypothetical protein FWG00_03440 [Coriobacteriia bacterium]|nr:hypothetical protein [Coriobacteriia bacterium]